MTVVGQHTSEQAGTLTSDGLTALPGFAELPQVSTEPAVLERFRVDRSGWTGPERPVAVARPRTVADVQSVLAFAHRHRIPVTPRGAGTGLSGGAVAADGGIVLDVSGLDRILRINAVDQLAIVEPGVLTVALDAAAAQHGLRYAPDPASAAISTIGGNIATNAGGLRCVKYGVTRDAVRALDVVLADGRLLRLGAATAKSVTGYDLTSLFVGSEGTLGVIVRATVSLIPLPTSTATATAYFDTVAQAAAAVAAVSAAGIRPAVAELLDGATLGAIDELHTDADLPQGTRPARHDAFVLIQTDGAGATAEIDLVAEVLAAYGHDVAVTTDPVEAERLLATRRDALPALERRGRVLIEDIAVPRSALAAAIDEIEQISERTGVQVYTFAHAGDGNLHPIIVVDPTLADADADADAPQTVPAIVQQTADQIFQLALDLGGTVTGEHGIGLLKQSWVARELDPIAHELQLGIRRLFDPAGILNPGKAL